ncbi:class I SAM-dependent methyltransferase [Nocardia wallacei]|uniref:class I SAM-dependent methyltransferase n=1 Tax=Nocardia wallacei TaxID=480035 RepID=UPI00245758A9|nr:class I SAM-dependent methyltransferase [Nocardia wallacei]
MTPEITRRSHIREGPLSGASGSLPNHIDEIEGWFYPTDHYLFDWVLGRHDAASGDLVELGAYMGKSAIYMGRHLREGETFTVCDLFDTPAPDTRTDKEMRVYYSTLTRAKFEQNYLRFHDVLPVIVEGPTAMLPSRVTPQSCRFAHVDASHLYEHVSADIDIVRDLLAPDGVVAIDDYRSPHTPGVAAATWEAVLNKGLRPIVVSESKFYGTWGNADRIQFDLLPWLLAHPQLGAEVHRVLGHGLTRAHHR